MTLEQARAVLLWQDCATEGWHHGHPDFRVGKTIFATLGPAQDRSVLRLPLGFAESMVEGGVQGCKIVSRAGGCGWLSVQLGTFDADEFEGLAALARSSLAK
jgi:hypothetical protein